MQIKKDNMIYVRKYIFFVLSCLFTFVIPGNVFAQQSFKLVNGNVSYITGQSVYIRFENTQGIENGDTLFVEKEGKLIPALTVKHHSSISCLGNYISDISLQLNDPVIARVEVAQSKNGIVPNPGSEVERDVNEQALISSTREQKGGKHRQDVSGRISVSSYSNLTNQGGNDYHRLRYTFSIDVENISNSRLSAETYISFSHRLNEWDVVRDNLNDALKIYSLALRYDFSENTHIWLGRKINPVIANMGAVDGLQVQHKFNNFFAGAVVGSRPDYSDYSFNPGLFEYGAYFGHSQKVENGFTQTSFALFEQRNNSNVDRRFAYFQHSNSIIKDISVFSSFELDLYKLENGQPKNSLSLTSLYFSLRYRVSRRLSLFGSYDSRRNIIYYETFKNYSDRVLQLAARQGLRFRINYRPVNYLNIGINAGTRSAKTDARATNTLNGFITYVKVPVIESSLTLSTNFMQTSYLNGQIYGARLSKDVVPGKIYAMLNYRRVDFNYLSSNLKLVQNIGEANLSFQFNRKLYLSVNYEITLQGTENFNRVYLNLRRKF